MNDVSSVALMSGDNPFPFNNQQLGALADIKRWFDANKSRKRTYSATGVINAIRFILQGYAGTGKTTLVKALLDLLGVPLSRIALVAPTNRAAKVLANKTGLLTRTLFSLIYSSQREELEFERQRLRSWDEASNFSQLGDLLIQSLEQDVDAEFEEEWMANGYDSDYGDNISARNEAYSKALENFREGRRMQILKFEEIELPESDEERLRLFDTMKEERILKHKKTIRDILDQDIPTTKRSADEITSKYDIILCDEASMVDLRQGNDLVGYGVPVILVGDPFQLPPVKAKAYWDGIKPDAVLTKIERQKGLGAGIPLAGEQLRTGGSVTRNESVGVHQRNTISDEMWLAADQILVGTHVTRERLCRYMRKLLGFAGDMPMVGEKIVAVYNDKPVGIMNGELYEVMASRLDRGGSVTIMTIKDPYGKIIENVKAWTKGFEGRSKTNYLDEAYGRFWFGYAITCHQSQGSEWKNVIVCDDWPKSDMDTWKRWLYTALTRASQRVEWIQ